LNQIILEQRPRVGSGLPRGVLYGAVALVSFALIASSVSQITGIGGVRMIEAEAAETLALKFEDRADGGVLIKEAADARTIYRVEPGTNGFIRATMRGLAMERKRDGVGEKTPFLLIHWTDGTISLEDPATSRKVDLDAFGPTNAAAFAQLFAARRRLR
jgi:putative photosynthetic complex assembly protein